MATEEDDEEDEAPVQSDILEDISEEEVEANETESDPAPPQEERRIPTSDLAEEDYDAPENEDYDAPENKDYDAPENKDDPEDDPNANGECTECPPSESEPLLSPGFFYNLINGEKNCSSGFFI